MCIFLRCVSSQTYLRRSEWAWCWRCPRRGINTRAEYSTNATFTKNDHLTISGAREHDAGDVLVGGVVVLAERALEVALAVHERRHARAQLERAHRRRFCAQGELSVTAAMKAVEQMVVCVFCVLAMVSAEWLYSSNAQRFYAQSELLASERVFFLYCSF